jgi:hypothetical protein
MEVRPLRTGLSYALAFFSLVSGGAEIRNVSPDRLVAIVSHPGTEPFQKYEAVCVFRNAERIACGFIDDRNELAGRLVLTSSSGVAIGLGDYVDRVQYTANVFKTELETNRHFITHEANRRWVAGDTACLARDNKVYGCGIVVSANDMQAELRIYEQKVQKPVIGDQVRRIGGQVNVLQTLGEDVTATQPPVESWKVGQPVAIFRKGRGIAVGRVAATYETGTRVRLIASTESPSQGDIMFPVAMIPAGAEPESPSAEVTSALLADATPKKIPGWLVSVGLLSFGESVRYLRLEKRLGSAFRLGLVNYLIGGELIDADLRGYGSILTASFYPFNGWLQGIAVQGGAGVLNLDAVGLLPESHTGLALSGAVGWRLNWKSGFSAGINGGALFRPGVAAGRLPRLLPYASLELGVQF